MAVVAVERLTVHLLEIPLRGAVEHAATARDVAAPIIVEVQLAGGVTGFGETLPRAYVTGETRESVLAAIQQRFVPALLECRPQRFTEALEFIEVLPWTDAFDRSAPAARAAVELALLDAYSRHFNRPIAESAANWMGLTACAAGRLGRVRVSGVVATGDVERALSRARLMRWYGLRDFKLKVGIDHDNALYAALQQRWRRGLHRGTLSLRFDANAAWSLADAINRLLAWEAGPVRLVEQPLARGDEQNLQDLKAATGWRVIHDESLITLADAERLVELGVADVFNIRVSKCGGFLPALRLAEFCHRQGIETVVGCMVGQTSLLSAVERRLLDVVPTPRFVESNYGRFLLRDDLTRRSLRFGYGGRLRARPQPGWGVTVDPAALETLAPIQPVHLPL